MSSEPRDDLHWQMQSRAAKMPLLAEKREAPGSEARHDRIDGRSPSPSGKTHPGPGVAKLDRVSKTFGSVVALRDVSVSIHGGEVVSVLGPNGAGKTTAIKLLLGLTGPTRGSVSVFGGDPRNPHNRLRTGAMLQVARVPETLRVKEHIDLFSSYYPKPLPLAETLAAAGLKELADRKFGELSGGQKQRALFALAICGDPDLVFLDEPTVGLDVEARRTLWEQILKLVARGKTVLLTTHYLQEADALSDRILLINKGNIIAQGSPMEIKSRTANRQIRCVCSLPIAEVCAIPGVLEVHADREGILITTAVPDDVLRELFRRDPRVSGIEVLSAGLEDAFLALTKENFNPEAMQ
jgi:ABC-2 type transport system ATP-binding protein